MVDRPTTANECLKWGKNPSANDSRRVQRQQGRRVTTATPEQTQERSDERALADAKMRDHCAFGGRWILAVALVARSKLAASCGLQVVTQYQRQARYLLCTAYCSTFKPNTTMRQIA